MMTPQEYLEKIIRPNLEDLAEDYSNERKALNVIHTIDALPAHIFHALGGRAVLEIQDDTAFRERLAAQNSDFGLLRDVAKAAKHVVLERGKPAVNQATQVRTKKLGWGEARYGEGRYGSPLQAVIVTNAGEHRVVEAVATEALAFLEETMRKYNLL